MKATTQLKWPTSRLRFLLNPGPTHDQREKLRQATQVTFLPMEAIGEQGELDLSTIRNLDEVKTGYTQFFDGAVIVAKITPCFENGKGALVQGLFNGVGFGTTELYVLSPGPELDGRFLYYVTRSSPFKKLGEAAMTGAAGQKRVPEEFVRNFRVVLRSLLQQHAMADFLDRETAKIDALIVAKERLLRILAEKRRALITHTVTRGLNPDTPFRDSGISCLGHIPSHWPAAQLRRFTRFITSGSRGWAEHYSDEGAIFIRIGNLTRDSISIDLSDIQHVNPPPGAEGERTKIELDDLLFSITAYLGSVAVTPDYLTGAYINQHIALVRLLPMTILPSYVAYAAISDVGQIQLNGQAYGGTKMQLALDDVVAIWLPVPPIDEQRAIVTYIASETAKLDAMRNATEKTIGLLKERRTALITAAVTGKIDVCGEVA